MAALILGLIGGFFILLGAAIMSVFTFGFSDTMTGMMMNMHGGMAMAGMMMGFAPALTIVGLASGTLVILGSVMLYQRPAENQVWGAIILAFSILSILGGMGGFIVGLVLGLVGGVLGLTWRKPPAHS